MTIPVDVLWAIVEPAATTGSWFPLCDRCEVLAGDGLGRRQRMHARWGRRAVEIDQEVIEYTPSARMTWKHVSERIGGKPAPVISTEVIAGIELESVGAGTRVVLTSRHVPSGLAASWLLRLVAAPRIRRAFNQALDLLDAAGGGR